MTSHKTLNGTMNIYLFTLGAYSKKPVAKHLHKNSSEEISFHLLQLWLKTVCYSA